MGFRWEGGLTAAEVVRVLAALHTSGFRAWVAGGWGVDALVGRQTRAHRDLDLALDVSAHSLESAIDALHGLGYDVETDRRPTRVELAAPSERWVDLHPVVFDDHGTGWQANVEGLAPFRYPPDAFTNGFVGGTGVGCLSVEQQLLFHSGYPLRARDLADIELLKQLTAMT